MNVKSIAFACCPSALKPMLYRVESSPLGYRLVKGVFWSMAGAVISRALMLVASILVARMLGKDIFGEYGMIRSTVEMFGIFAGFGLGLTATKHVAEFRDSDPERAGRIIGMAGLFAMLTGGLISLILLFCAPWLAEHTINAPHLTGVLRIGAIILFINAVNGAQTGALAGFESFKAIAYVNLFVGLISFPILTCGAYFGGLTGAVWALAINLGFNWLFNHLALRKETNKFKVPFTFKNCTAEWGVLWTFSLPAALGGVLVGPVRWICNAFLVNQSDGYSQMGIFTATLIFQQILLFASNMLNAPLLSMLSHSETRGSSKLGTVNIISNWILGVIVATPLLCFPELAQLTFGAEYATRNFQITFSLIIFCTAIMTFKAGLTRVIIVNNLLWIGFFSNVFWAIVLISSAAWLVEWGALGLALSLVIAHILQTIVLFPIYFSRNLVPKGTLFSVQSVSIWLILTFLVLLNISDASLLFRTMAFIPSLLFTVLAFKIMLKRGIAPREN